MIVTRIFAEDLFSYKVLDLPLANLGLVLVEGDNRDMGGSNGAGKSSIFEIFLWTVFGITARGVKADGVIREDLQHNPITGCSRGVVEIDLEGRKLQIFRHRKHKQYENRLIVMLDGVDLSMPRDKGGDLATQDVLNQLIGMDADACTNSIMFPQMGEGFAGKGDSAQKGIFDSLLGTARFDKARDRAKVRYDELLRTIEKLEIQIAAQQNAQTAAIPAEKLIRDNIALYEKTRTEKLAELKQRQLELKSPDALPDGTRERKKQIEDHLREHDAFYKNVDAQISSTNVAIGEWSKRIGQTETRISNLQDKPDPPTEPKPGRLYQDILDSHDTAVKEWKAVYEQLIGAKSRLDAHDEQKKTYDQSADCAECGQPLSAETKERLFGKLNSNRSELVANVERLERELLGRKQLQNDLHVVKDCMEAWLEYEGELASWVDPEPIKAELAGHQSNLATLKEQLTVYQQSKNQYHAMKTEAVALNGSITAFDQAQMNYELGCRTIAQDVASFEQAVNPNLEMLRQHEINVQQYAKAIARLSKLRDRLCEDADAVQFWVEGFGNKGMKSLVFDFAVPTLENTANLYLDCLSNGTASLTISTVSTIASGETRDKFDVTTRYRSGGGNFNKASGGEKRRVDLALLFALGELGSARARSPIRLRLLDEPFDSLDAVGAEQVVDLLNQFIVPKAGTVLVMSHNDNLKSLIPRRLMVVKERGVSRIES